MMMMMMMTPAHAFASPVYAGLLGGGLGGLGWIFPVQDVRVTTAGESDNIRAELAHCADFFVDAFWTSKLQLRDNSSTTKSSSSSSIRQRDSLYQQQWAEFTKRYGNVRRNSELVILKQQQKKQKTTKMTADTTSYIGGDTDNDDEIILGIVGVEVDRVPLDPNNDAVGTTTTRTVPVMSNLAVAKSYRRRGLAERLVQSAEKIVRDSDWNYGGGNTNDDDDDRCCLYLYVEQQNVPAVRLYRKLGYTVVWKNVRAESAVPTSTGSLRTTTTTVLCMKKQLINTKRRFFFF
jgi:ribosomal protein S18 acetylase RimI-like enzyme